MSKPNDFQLQCPIPLSDYPRITMAHGGGGRLSRQLISDMFKPLLSNNFLDADHDGAVLSTDNNKIAFTTDSHVIQPLFYPGGDIGTLAVFGTVNDIAMCGARPLYLSLAFILEEGLSMETLWRVMQSIAVAAKKANVQIVTGDTKVVDRAKGGELYINTSGVGVIEHSLSIQPASIRQGDHIILNGDLGRHGIAIMATREGLEFETTIESDCAPLNGLVQNLLDAKIPIHCLRDLTRGGLASALVEIADTSAQHITIIEKAIPVREDVQGACEILGFDPFFVANEGKFVVFVAPDFSDQVLEIMHRHPMGKEAALIGEVTQGAPGRVMAKNDYGGTRILDMFSGEQLPRIC